MKFLHSSVNVAAGHGQVLDKGDGGRDGEPDPSEGKRLHFRHLTKLVQLVHFHDENDVALEKIQADGEYIKQQLHLLEQINQSTRDSFDSHRQVRSQKLTRAVMRGFN